MRSADHPMPSRNRTFLLSPGLPPALTLSLSKGSSSLDGQGFDRLSLSASGAAA